MKKFENILVAFDLNKTLFFKSESPLPRMHDSKIKKRFFYVRPHIKELVEFLHSHEINYCFWSNMIAKNCKLYVKELESFGMSRHCGIFDQEFCDKPEGMSEFIEQGEKIKFIKNLNKLANLFQIDVNHCILVDDSKEKNVEGCHLIHANSYEGNENDKEILNIIEKIKEFRKDRVNEELKSYHKLKYIDHTEHVTYKIEEHLVTLKLKEEIKPVEKTPAEIELENQLNDQLKKFKAELVLEKETKKNIKTEIQLLEKSIQEMAEQVKKESEGKCVRKGDQLLVQVLMFAKNKKASEQKLQELEKKKKESEEKISTIKKLMREIVKKLNINDEEVKEEEQKNEINEEKCSEKKNKKPKKSKKEKLRLEGEKHENSIEVPVKPEEAKNQHAKAEE